MKKITLCLSLFFSLGLSAQALEREKNYALEVSKINDIQQLLEMVREKGEKQQYADQEVALQRLISLRPYNPDFRFALARTYAIKSLKLIMI